MERFDTTSAVLISILSVILLGTGVPPAHAEGSNADGTSGSSIEFGFEVRGHWRDSDAARFASPFPFPPEIFPPGQNQAFQETVEPGEHTEISLVSLWLTAQWGQRWSSKVKVDLIDLYERNPTSTDRELDVDEVWIRWGEEALPAELPERSGAYVKLGKFPKFERQNDRHLESYGLLSTAFNRFEDVGVEVGINLGRRFFIESSFTQGNPVFFRDPNALAGDNGTADANGAPLVIQERGAGFPIFYDADVEDLDFENPEVGVSAGWRFGDRRSGWGAEFVAWAYERDLADAVEMGGTVYEGDLDLFTAGPNDAFSLTTEGRKKEEFGYNLWVYVGDLSIFGQYVDQDMAGLERTGYEAEVAWFKELPYLGAIGGRQVLSYIAPAVRYSKLEPRYAGDSRYPAPSVRWEWEKVDWGFNLGVVDGLLDLTVEWNDNTFVRLGQEESADEFLTTVRWQMDWGR